MGGHICFFLRPLNSYVVLERARSRSQPRKKRAAHAPNKLAHAAHGSEDEALAHRENPEGRQRSGRQETAGAPTSTAPRWSVRAESVGVRPQQQQQRSHAFGAGGQPTADQPCRSARRSALRAMERYEVIVANSRSHRDKTGACAGSKLALCRIACRCRDLCGEIALGWPTRARASWLLSQACPCTYAARSWRASWFFLMARRRRDETFFFV